MRATPRPFAVAVALALVYVLWGSTAPAIKIAVSTIPPFAMAMLRFGIAGSALWAWCRLRGKPLPTRREWMLAAITGTTLLAVSNGLFAWVLQSIPSGIGAVFFALAPLWMAVFAFAMYGERLSRVAAAGLFVGLGGMIYLYSPSGAQDLPLVPTCVGVFCSVSWAFGGMLQRRLAGSDLVQICSMQMLVAGTVLAVVAFATGERLSVAAFAPDSILALGYLIVFGSLLGFSAFLWLMGNVPTTLASTYAYVNPVVSLAIGVGLLHERFDWHLAIGATAILCGVVVMMLAPRAVIRRPGPSESIVVPDVDRSAGIHSLGHSTDRGAS